MTSKTARAPREIDRFAQPSEYRERGFARPLDDAIEIHASTRVVCHCLGVTAGEIHRAVAAGLAECVKTVIDHTGAGSGCTACHCEIKELLERRQVRVQSRCERQPARG
jgi:NAD(P)H-nitrite reductase large subunit